MESGIKNGTEVTLNLSSNVFADFNNENNFPYKFLLTDRQFLRLCKVFPNNSSANMKLSKTQLSMIIQLRRFLKCDPPIWISAINSEFIWGRNWTK